MMIGGGPAITCGNGNKEDCTTNELPVPDEWVKPLYDAGHKDYHDLKLNTTAKTPKRPPIPLAKPGDTKPKAPDASTKPLPATGGALSQKKDEVSPACKEDPTKCSSHELPLPKKLEWPLFPEQHKDYHDFKPAPCFDQNGKFMDRCNPYSEEKKKVEAQDKATATKYNPVADGKKEDEDKAAKDAAKKAKKVSTAQI